MAVQRNSLSESCLQLIPERVTQLSNRVSCNPCCGQLAGGAKRNIKHNALGSGAAARFMTSAVDQRFQADALTNVKNTHAFGGVHFVSGYGEQIDAQLIDIRRNLARGLRCIGVEQNSALTSNSA